MIGLSVALSASWLAAASGGPVAPSLVSPVPASFSPAINDGAVDAIAQVGDQMVIGGSFTNATSSDVTLRQPDALSFNASTGALDTTGFRPTINGQVNAVIPGANNNEVYIGGDFSTVDGHAMRVALLNIHTGKIVAGWNPPIFDLGVNKLALANHQLFVGGDFRSVGTKTRDGLVSLDPATGKPTSYVRSNFTGHHNYGTLCNPNKNTCASGHTGVRAFAVNPAGTRLVVTGNFTAVNKTARNQVAMLSLGAKSASLDMKWATDAYTAKCFSGSYDGYVRDVAFSPDGSYFVITATGGLGTNSDGTDSLCDAAARFNTVDKGADVRPQWVAYTGEDSLYSTAITGVAVYVGGHQRWFNNRYGQNVAGPGAVPRPSIAALNPANGLPYSWNPGKNPRGNGVFAILPTADGLWVGSDSDYVGNRTYLRPKLAFFPLAGGPAVPAETTSNLPGRVFELGDTSSGAVDPGRISYREFNGSESGQQVSTPTPDMDWSTIRGAFYVDRELFFGETDGNLYERPFDGTTLGTQVLLDPWNDPSWDSVQTGSGQTYQGLPSSFQSDIPTVSSMFFLNGRLYYTMTGAKAMFWRTFEPESGIVGAEKHTLTDNHDWSNIAGAFVTPSNELYFADQSTGELKKIMMTPTGAVGSASVVDTNADWASRGLVLLDQSDAPTPAPTAAFTVSCTKSASCAFTATPWSDPDGGDVRYSWSFGDGGTQAPSMSTTASHQYTANGTVTATLTVTDTAGATASANKPITINSPVQKITFVGASGKATKSGSASLHVPKRVKRHYGLLLGTATTGHRTPVLPKGWHKIGVTHHRGLTTATFDRIATNRILGTKVKVKFRKGARSTAFLTAYRHVSPTMVERSAKLDGAGSKSHPTPLLHHLTSGTEVVAAWTSLSDKKTRWYVPAGLSKRERVEIGKKPWISTALGDVALTKARFKVGAAKSSVKSLSTAQWAIALAPALA